MKEECRKNFERISEYLDGELDQDFCYKIEQHLEQCPECRACVDALRKTIDLCKKTAIEKVPPETHDRLRLKLRECFGKREKETL